LPYYGQFDESTGKKEGYGTELDIKNHLFYEGQFHNGRREGFGRQVIYDGNDQGTIYKGQWRVGKYHGEGNYEWMNKDKFIGHFHEGHFSGPGLKLEKNGSQFMGEFKRHFKDGFGVTRLENGDVQVG
jgi:hypothetical protein